MKKQFFPVFASLLILSVIGCVSLPKPEEMQAEVETFTLPKMPEPGKAIVYVVRPSSAGAIIRFNVFIDDHEDTSEMGFTRGSQYIYFNLMPGEHTILSKAENWAEAKITAKAGDIIYVEQDPSMGIIMARNSLRIPPDYEGKYQVKHLTLGTIIKADK
jgi:hypothetical protein